MLSAVTAVPLAVGWLTQTPDNRFVGFADKVPDAASYVARMKLGYDGAWLYRNPYTSAPHPATATNVFFLFLGHACRWLHLPLTLGFHVFRVGFGGLMLACVGWLAAICLPSRTTARAAVGLLAFSGGLGFWTSALPFPHLTETSLDLWAPETTAFYSFMVNPLFCLGVAFLALILGQAYLATRQDARRCAAAVLVLSAILCVVHPYEGLTLNALVPVICLTALGEGRGRAALRTWLSMVCGTAPVLFYYHFTYRTNPGLQGVLEGNVVLTPSPVWVASGLGLLLPLGALGWLLARRQRAGVPAFVAAWAVAQLLLLYAPVALQRKLILGLQVPLCLLAAIAWTAAHRWADTPGEPVRRLCRLATLGTIVVLLGSSNAFVVARQCIQVGSGHRLFHVAADEVSAMKWLGRHTKGQGVVLTSRQVGLFTPVIAGNPVVVGHWDETPSFDQRHQDSQRFFARATANRTRRALLARFRVEYVIVGSEDRGSDKFDAGTCPLLKRIFARPTAEVFSVVAPGRERLGSAQHCENAAWTPPTAMQAPKEVVP